MQHIMAIRCLRRKEHVHFLISGVPAELSSGDTISLSLFNQIDCAKFRNRNWVVAKGLCFLSCWVGEELFEFLLRQTKSIHPEDPRVYELPTQEWK